MTPVVLGSRQPGFFVKQSIVAIRVHLLRLVALTFLEPFPVDRIASVRQIHTWRPA